MSTASNRGSGPVSNGTTGTKLSIGPWYHRQTWGRHLFGLIEHSTEYVADANAPGHWRAVQYRWQFYAMPLTWWRRV